MEKIEQNITNYVEMNRSYKISIFNVLIININNILFYKNKK